MLLLRIPIECAILYQKYSIWEEGIGSRGVLIYATDSPSSSLRSTDSISWSLSYVLGKVIAKKRATLSNMDSRMLQEKQFLQALKGECFCIPIVSAIIPDSKTITMIYTDYYTCDLSSAISSGILTDKSRIWYLACIYSAIKALHSCGLMHRFINPGSIFITDRGIAKVSLSSSYRISFFPWYPFA